MAIVEPLVAMAAACEQVRTGEVEEIELHFEEEREGLDGSTVTSSLNISVRKDPWRPLLKTENT